MLSALQFSVFLLSSFVEDFVFVSCPQKNGVKKGNTLTEFKYLLFRSRINFFNVKDFSKKFDRWQFDQKMCLKGIDVAVFMVRGISLWKRFWVVSTWRAPVRKRLKGSTLNFAHAFLTDCCTKPCPCFF